MLIVISFLIAQLLLTREQECVRKSSHLYITSGLGGGRGTLTPTHPIFLSHFLCVTDFLNMDITKSGN